MANHSPAVHGTQGVSDQTVHIKTYVGVFLALMVLTIVTVTASSLKLAIPLAIGVALLIAAVKGSLVASFFMHLIGEKRWIYGALLLTVVFFLLLMFLPVLTYWDRVQYR